MSIGCELGIGKTFDLGQCISTTVAGWVPDWLVPLLPYWPWAAVLVGAGLAWRFAGAPGLATFAAAVGFILGRRSVKQEPPAQPTAPKPVTKPKKRSF